MMRLPCPRFALAAALATLAMSGGFVGAASRSYPGPTRANAKLWLTANSRKAPSGCPVSLTAHLRNVGKGPIYIPAGVGPLRFFKVNTNYIGHRGPVLWLRAGSMGRRIGVHSFIAVGVLPGKTVRFWREVEINRYFDMSMPGQYAIRFAIGRLESNWLKLLIKPPVIQSPAGSILRPSLKVWPRSGEKKRSNIQVRLVGLTHAGKAHPVGVWACLRGRGNGGKNVELTGNRLLDLGVIQVEGPDGYNGDELVKSPKPHYIPIPNHQQVPLTAYGEWLRKHPPKELKAKRFTLEPGVVYKYAEPINLSCQYDMSLPGVYRVRVELAHTHIWSPWVNITVPFR